MDDMSREKQITPLPDVIAGIKRDLGGKLQLLEELHGGVSGSRVYRGLLKATRGNGVEVILKHERDVGVNEKQGAELVGTFLCLPEGMHWGDDHVLYRFVHGPTVDTAVRARQVLNGAAPLDEFAEIHADMWCQTWRNNISLVGYAGKIEHTWDILSNTRLKNSGGDSVPLIDFADHQLIINGVPVGSIQNVFGVMAEVVKSQASGVMSHGDENPGNAIIDAVDNKQVMVDFGMAGVRSPAEPIAKILLWFDASASYLQSCEVVERGENLILNTRAVLPDYILESVRSVRQKLEPWLSTLEQTKVAAAYMMMYLFRELQWLERRGRSDMAPHLLAKALSFAPAMEGKTGGFPLSAREEV